MRAHSFQLIKNGCVTVQSMVLTTNFKQCMNIAKYFKKVVSMETNENA